MTEEARERVAEGAHCTVDVCGCGVLHVSLGPITVRLHADVVESVWVTLGEALGRLGARRAARVSAPPSLAS